MNTDNIISHSHVLQALGISRVTLWRMRSRGDFIPAVLVSKRKIAFSRDEFDYWLQSRTLH